MSVEGGADQDGGRRAIGVGIPREEEPRLYVALRVVPRQRGLHLMQPDIAERQVTIGTRRHERADHTPRELGVGGVAIQEIGTRRGGTAEPHRPVARTLVSTRGYGDVHSAVPLLSFN